MKQLLILTAAPANDIHAFVEYWQKLYSYGNEEKYYNNIKVIEFKEQNIIDLFEWKNGMTLVNSGGKEQSFKSKIVSKIDIINAFKNTNIIDLDHFNQEFKTVSAVWRIFLLHIIKPQQYPIYDQHIHRAYHFIFDEKCDDISNTKPNKDKFEFYFGTYLPFIQSLNYPDLKALDEAFFAFGQYLKTRNQAIVFN